MKFLVLIFCTGLFWACKQPYPKEESTANQPLKIACAANMFVALDSIVQLFTQTSKIKCEVISASSGMLTAQIENGAPYDIFLSANMDYPRFLFEQKITTNPVIYAKGRLVFVYNRNEMFSSIEEALKSDKIRRIAIANKETAPYGEATCSYFDKADLNDEIKSKLVIGESVGQVNNYIATSTVEAGFTSYSFMVKNEETYNFIEVDPGYFEPIEQGMTIVKNGNQVSAQKFLDYLRSSDTCDRVLKHFGYLTH